LNFVDRWSKVNIFRWCSLVFNWFASTVCWERNARICLWTGVCKRSLIKYRAMPLITRDENCFVAASHAVGFNDSLHRVFIFYACTFFYARSIYAGYFIYNIALEIRVSNFWNIQEDPIAKPISKLRKFAKYSLRSPKMYV